MKSVFVRWFFASLLAGTMVFQTGCISADPNAVFDQTTTIEDLHWQYTNPVKYDVKIPDQIALYNLYLNLRVTADYRYANIFVRITVVAPDKKKTTLRVEFPLADKAGEWYGNGSGNLFNYQMKFENRIRFPLKGIYHFSIEQNMRDNPLNEVSDVGLRVEMVD